MRRPAGGTLAQAIVFLKTQLIGTTTTRYVPIESPEALLTRMDILANELDAAEYEYEKLMSELDDLQQLCTCGRKPHLLARKRHGGSFF